MDTIKLGQAINLEVCETDIGDGGGTQLPHVEKVMPSAFMGLKCDRSVKALVCGLLLVLLAFMTA